MRPDEEAAGGEAGEGEAGEGEAGGEDRFLAVSFGPSFLMSMGGLGASFDVGDGGLGVGVIAETIGVSITTFSLTFIFSTFGSFVVVVINSATSKASCNREGSFVLLITEYRLCEQRR